MVEVPISECSDYVDDCTIARSKFKIPRIAEGNYQYVIQGVYRDWETDRKSVV